MEFGLISEPEAFAKGASSLTLQALIVAFTRFSTPDTLRRYRHRLFTRAIGKDATVELNARTLLLICWTVANWAFSFGLGSQLASQWLNTQGQSDTVIGIATRSTAGMATASFVVPLVMRQFGSIPCVTLGMTFRHTRAFLDRA